MKTFGFLILLSWAGACFSVARERPNVLMFAVDDLRPLLGCYGDPRAKTPHLDRLASRGMLFERAYCQYSKCGPSRLSLLTGLRPESVGVYGNNVKLVRAFRERRPDATPLPRWLKQHGYEARGFGKIDHDGWSDPEDWSAPPFSGRDGEMLEVRDESNPDGPTVIAERWACPVVQSPDVADDYFFAGRMASEVIERLRARKSEKPFFYAVGFRRPHLPFIAPKRYFDLHQPDVSWLAEHQQPPAGVPPVSWFSSDAYIGGAKRLGLTIPLAPTREEAIALNGFELRSYRGAPDRGPFSTEKQLELIHAYTACVSYVDAQIGRILDAIDAAGFDENTIVLLWSDHGWHLGESSVWSKMTNYETGTRIPLIISVPGMAPGRTRSFAGLIDLYPTLCELCGVDSPAHLEGKSLVPILEDPAVSVQDAMESVFVRYRGDFFGRTLRVDGFRYLRWESRDGRLVSEEWYDLKADPHEQKNRVTTGGPALEKARKFLEK